MVFPEQISNPRIDEGCGGTCRAESTGLWRISNNMKQAENIRIYLWQLQYCLKMIPFS
jgi:hypothetical protein